MAPKIEFLNFLREIKSICVSPCYDDTRDEISDVSSTQSNEHYLTALQNGIHN
jgi:hypothetical protein